jgi:hypothetical protein
MTALLGYQQDRPTQQRPSGGCSVLSAHIDLEHPPSNFSGHEAPTVTFKESFV